LLGNIPVNGKEEVKKEETKVVKEEGKVVDGEGKKRKRK
jgi:hypothetical protein